MIKEFDIISAGTTIRGAHHTTDDAKATVIFLTGDGKSGTQSSTWPTLTEAMLAAGINVCTFDFHSQGRSDGERSELTLRRAIANFNDFLDYLDSKRVVLTDTIFCLGSSFGAAVLLNAPHTFKRFKKISFKSPAFDLSRAYDRELGNVDGLSQWRSVDVHPDLGLPFEAYLDALKSNGFAGLLEIHCPVLITIGGNDEIVGVEDCYKASYLRPDIVDLRVLPGVLHNYKQYGAKDAFEDLNTRFFGADL